MLRTCNENGNFLFGLPAMKSIQRFASSREPRTQFFSCVTPRRNSPGISETRLTSQANTSYAQLSETPMRRRRTLITSPLEWQMTALPVAHPALPVVAERGGTQLRTPRPVIVVDTREQNPFSFARFTGWVSGLEKKALELGDYTVAGLENSCVVERKDLGDLVPSFTAER